LASFRHVRHWPFNFISPTVATWRQDSPQDFVLLQAAQFTDWCPRRENGLNATILADPRFDGPSRTDIFHIGWCDDADDHCRHWQSNHGLAVACSALKPGGVLAVWSAREDRRFEQRLRAGSFDVTVERVRGRLKKGGPRHVIFLAAAPSRSA